MSKKGRISAVVALKSVVPPSRPKVDGHECPRHLTVKPLRTASSFESEQMDCLSVVFVCGRDMIALIPSLKKITISDGGKAESGKTDDGTEQSIGPQPLRIAHVSRYCVMLGIASRRAISVNYNHLPELNNIHSVRPSLSALCP